MTPRSSRTAKSNPIVGIAKSAAAVGVCASLAACSAHERRTASAPAAPQPVALAQAAPSQTVSATATSAPAQVAAVSPAASGQPVAKAVVVGSNGGAGGVRMGKSGSGLASWYGDRFHGRKTANGERFNMASLTAAHRSFPLPSYVRVTNVSNGRSVVVRVNDRGPFHGGRVIDVSKRAADVLGFRGHGVGNVKLDYVGKASDASDDQRLLASYQEFGRPSVPPGMQVAAFTPVSDADLAGGSGGAYAIASRAVSGSASYVMASASSAASSVRSAASATASTARDAVRKILPANGSDKPVQSEASQPVVAAYAPPQPQIVAVPPAIATGATEPQAKRVVRPMEPALASAAPALRPSVAGADVSSRIASSFDSFGPSATTVTTGASVSAEATR